MSRSDKPQFWQAHINAWKASGLSQAQYCQQQEIQFHTFAYWRTRLNRTAAPKSRLLKLGGVSTASRISLALPLGIRLDVAAEDLPTVLPLVLDTVRDRF
jgi:hypothetical protein